MATGVNSGYDAAEAARIRAEEEARRRAEEEARKRAAEEARKKAEAEAQKKAQEEAQKAQETKEAERQIERRDQGLSYSTETSTGESIFGANGAAQDEGLKTQQVKGNDEWVQSLQERGLRTTGIHDREANFEDYGNALSTELQQAILNSFDNEQDYELQAQLATIFSNTNYRTHSEVIAACKQLGINVNIEYVKTTYIHDNKYDGHWNKTQAQNGSIAVFTFSDGKGGEIKVADANGNGALETEELFVNEILTGIAADLKVSASNMSLGGHGGSSSRAVGNTGKTPEEILKDIFGNSNHSFSDLIKDLQEFRQQIEEDNKKKEEETDPNKTYISQSAFDEKVNEKTKEYMEDDALQYSVAYNRALEEISKKYAV